MTSSKNSTSKRFKAVHYLIFMVGITWLFLVGIFIIPRFPSGPYFLYADLTPEQEADVISYDKLTAEDSHPFIHSDKNYPFSVDGRVRARKNLKEAIIKFPDTPSCLIKATRNKQKPDLRLINWDAFRTLQDVNVCFWRIFSSLETPEKVEKWLYFQNAKNVYFEPILNQNSYTTDYIVSHHLKVNWAIRGEKSLPFPSKGIRLFNDGGLSQTVGFTCFWDGSGKLRSVSARWGAVL